ncbi:Nodulation protein NolT precursor [Candidatus Xiphinematobacter sp. Idaho Grape]|uniref:type III secretion system inner membrane ring lipoprotein SctJ n=1 Tax=Candidatus Xiphinematobacter sp. Idaho Grape TaxID=1704307 RepID=UPI000706E628|nr:type III secretion inner membrane ring lipoprotein SctJ [Candidatus Xiphinematobacter sp. Idaho Grape]ALJ56903.1 Nodulation protein NolT precursor [Candidatus Xiphinematobacter sp. Idaho Grape]
MDPAYQKRKRKKWRRQGIGFLLWCCTLFLTGCETRELHSNLLESDANTMLGVLLARDIQAIKLQGKDKLFSVAVPKSQFAKAVELLQWYGIPQESFSGIGRIFSKSGIVSSPTEEKIRFMYALSQDIAETLSHLDGIVTSRVNLVLPKNNPYSETSTPSSASVFLKCRPGFDATHLLPQIKALVMNSVEGLSYNRISVTIVESRVMDLYSPVETVDSITKVLGVKVSSDSVHILWRVWGISILVAVAVGVIVGGGLFWLFKEIRDRRMVVSSE